MGVFAFQGIRQIDGAVSLLQILFVDMFGAKQLGLQAGLQALGQDGGAVLGSFPIADHDLRLLEIQVFDSQADALANAQPAAIEQFGHQPMGASQASQQLVDLIFGEHGGQVSWAAGADGLQVEIQRFEQHMYIKEGQGIERLVLGGGGHVLLDGQVSQESFDLRLSEFSRVAFVVEEDEAPDSIEVGGLGLILEHDPRFLRRIAQARESLRAGKGIPLEEFK
jgi:hypothetical protein